MEFMTILFVLMNVLILVYIFHHIRVKKRVHNLIEFFFILVYVVVTLIALFPQLLSVIEDVLNISSALNFIIYTSIFVSYFLIYILYRKVEKQRSEITNLVREVALRDAKKRK